MNMQNVKKKILFVCGGNTCRSPMAKVVVEQMIQKKGLLDKFEVDSAAYDGPTYLVASKNAREAIKTMLKTDLLSTHRAKKLTPDLVEWADLILVMGARMKKGLPPSKTWTLKEFAGGSGDVADPFGGNLNVYLACAHEISETLEAILRKLA